MFWTLLFSSAVFNVHAGEQPTPFSPASLLEHTQHVAVESSPLKLGIYENKVIVLGSSSASPGNVSILDVATLKLENSLKLSVVPQDMVVDQHGQVFIIGTGDTGTSQILSLDRSLQILDTYDAGKVLAMPVLSLPRTDILIVGSMNEPMIIIETKLPASLKVSDTFKSPNASKGVGLTWASADYRTLFVNLNSDISLAAFDIESARQLDNIGYTIKSGSVEPFQTVAVTGEYPCRSATGVSFLIWDLRRESLTLAEFDPTFRSLDIQTSVQTRLKNSDTTYRRGFTQQSSLIASSCDQSAIVLGSAKSKQISQYAVNIEYRSIEVTGIVEVPFAPTAIAMDPKGRFALVASQDERLIARYEPRVADEAYYVQSDPAIRQLQRLLTDNGYPVGSVDGIMGPATERALELYKLNTGKEIDVENLNVELEKSRAKLRY